MAEFDLNFDTFPGGIDAGNVTLRAALRVVQVMPAAPGERSYGRTQHS